MIIRQSAIDDVPAMVDLLKQSIGEILTPKTESYFLWKHEKNVFGKSKILVAVENQKIIGLRAFMRWQWVSGRETVSAIRAVDTATDPAFQGKGIFKKLTLQGVEECTSGGTGLVFNTPNAASMQGYLKMGWHVAGKLPLKINFGSFFPRKYSPLILNSYYDRYSIENALQMLKPDWKLPPAHSLFCTTISFEYLKWRYGGCPVARYGAVIEAGQFGFIFRIKKINRFVELRICEVWTENDSATHPARVAFRKVINAVQPALVSCSAMSPFFASGQKQIFNFLGTFKKGPLITLRPLAKNDLDAFNNFQHWAPSLGSMELF